MRFRSRKTNTRSIFLELVLCSSSEARPWNGDSDAWDGTDADPSGTPESELAGLDPTPELGGQGVQSHTDAGDDTVRCVLGTYLVMARSWSINST